MSQAAINLVAIAIFTMTFSALLSPWLPISPAVPALFTVSLLGLATLDSFSWQGRGLNLLLDWIAQRSPQHRERVIRHEAGHFLVAHQLQIPVTGYTLSAWETLRQGQSGLGGVQFDLQELERELQRGTLSEQLLDRYCTVWMAGAEAEKLAYGNAEGGADDRQKLRAVLAGLRFPPAQVEQKERWATLRARTILQEHSPVYDALVTAMEQRESVETCDRILSQSTPS